MHLLIITCFSVSVYITVLSSSLVTPSGGFGLKSCSGHDDFVLFTGSQIIPTSINKRKPPSTDISRGPYNKGISLPRFPHLKWHWSVSGRLQLVSTVRKGFNFLVFLYWNSSVQASEMVSKEKVAHHISLFYRIFVLFS